MHLFKKRLFLTVAGYVAFSDGLLILFAILPTLTLIPTLNGKGKNPDRTLPGIAFAVAKKRGMRFSDAAR
ncbi:MAG: hypothetical protein HY742_01460 [Deltaproteobacteria bacterium]|jgi:hypothetical protein|nr:hypothetical protein [Deltaproteobacteria bacterium]